MFKHTMLTIFIFLSLTTLSIATGGSMSSSGQQSSTVTIYGSAANYLYYSFMHEDLTFTQCVRGPREGYLGTVECVMEVNEAEKISQDEILIFGFAAKELYEVTNLSPDDSGIACFIEVLESGEKRVGCKLKSFIVETEGL